MKKFTTMIVIIVATAISSGFVANAQVSINADGSSADPSAMLDVKSSSKGFLLPRMTETEIGEISNPANGLMVINTNDNRLYIYDSDAGEWKEIAIGTGTIAPTPTWTCGDPLVDTRDSKSYATVQIGTQCWMAENLNIGTRIDGVTNQTDNSTIEKYCYDNSTANCDVYGGLYQWDEMMQYVTTEGAQGICPTGWHIPTDDEIKTMEMHLGMSASETDNTGWRGTNEGSKLASNASLWDDGILESDPDFGISGFACIPGGFRDTDGSFLSTGKSAVFWSSSENGPKQWRRHLSHQYTKVYRDDYNKINGYSVRCVRD